MTRFAAGACAPLGRYGAGQLPMVVPGHPTEPPEVTWGPTGPLPMGLIEEAEGAVNIAFSMVHEYNVLQIQPDYIGGSYNPGAWEGLVTQKLAAIDELVHTGYQALIDFLSKSVTDFTFWFDQAQQIPASAPEARAMVKRVLQYYVDMFHLVGPKIATIQDQLALAGKLVQEKIRGIADTFKRKRESSTASLSVLATKGAAWITGAAKAVKEELDKTIEKATPAVRYYAYAVGGLAALAAIIAGVIYLPKPRRR